MTLVNSNDFILRKLPPHKSEFFKIVSNGIGDTDNFIYPRIEVGRPGYRIEYRCIPFDSTINEQFDQFILDQLLGILQGCVVEYLSTVEILIVQHLLNEYSSFRLEASTQC